MTTSEFNQFLDNIDEKVLECTICFKRLQNPKSLNCLHSFCLACLEDWVKTKGKLTCPTCSKSYPIPEGGLQKLPPNTFINNLLETIEQFVQRDQKKCVCGNGDAKYYCQECRKYFCSTCSDHHKDYRLFANHKLHSVEYMRSMTPLQITSLHPPQCSLHNEPLKFFCSICNIPICMHCTITDHSAWEGNHKPISISKAFQTFKETSATLEKAVNDCKNKLQDGLKAVTQSAKELEKCKDTSLRDIDNLVQAMVKTIKDSGDKLKNEVATTYKKKKKVFDRQMKAVSSDINAKLGFLNQLLKSDEATAMQSSAQVITALKDRINELPKTEPGDNGDIKFLINQQLKASLQQCDIGYVLHMRAADSLILKGAESVTQCQPIKIIKTDECEIHANQLKATWTQPTGETIITQVEEDDNGDYFVTGKCMSPGVCKLNVSANGEAIKQSPTMIKVEKEGLINNINLNEHVVLGVVKCENDCLWLSTLQNNILMYKQSGECIGNFAVLPRVRVRSMYAMKNNNIAFIDCNSNDIKVCNMNGQLIKSIGQGVLNTPSGIYVDEASNIVYVGEWKEGCVFMFDIASGKKIGSLGNQKDQQLINVIDITHTNQGYLLLVDFGNSRLQLYDGTIGSFIKILVESGYENGKVRNPRGVVVDEDDNIIIASDHKLQLFSRDGNFIKRIDNEKDGINCPQGLSIISYHPRRLAVVNVGDNTVKIFNY